MSEYVTEWMPDHHAYKEEIVRCMDCRYYSEYQDLCERLRPGMLVMDADGYCAWGERRAE